MREIKQEDTQGQKRKPRSFVSSLVQLLRGCISLTLRNEPQIKNIKQQTCHFQPNSVNTNNTSIIESSFKNSREAYT